MITKEKLKAFGANTEEGITRCAGMEDFYLQMVEQSLSEARIPDLRSAIEKKDYTAAFETAHALKGIFSNLSIDPLLEPVGKLTEILRAAQKDGITSEKEQECTALLSAAEAKFEEFKKLF